ncbi:MAG TPA: TIGR00366 family protein [Candidatus Solibacter sp.]|nr:TIGR00366 family protein [Candidatus Solibacter sp.]
MAPELQHESHTSRLTRFSHWMAGLVPDAITASVILTLIISGLALGLGNSFERVMDAYHQGLWMLLPFTMQMTLIIVLSSALASTPFLRRAIGGLARLPRTRNQVIVAAFLAAGVASYLYWGLGYALGPIVAIYYASEAERKGIDVDFPFLLGVTTAAQALWQYGPSSSGPLLVASTGHFLQSVIGVMPLSKTIWSPAAIIHEIVYSVLAMAAACWLMPTKCRPISQFPASCALAKPATAAGEAESATTFSDRLERGFLVPLVMCTMLAVWLWYHFVLKGLSLDINSLNATLLLLTFLFHRSVLRFVRAIREGVGSSWAVIVLYHLYAGVAGMVQLTSVGAKAADWAASISTASTFPLITAITGTVFACFIPSSGGQWTVQGFVTVKTAMAVGVSVPRGMLALGVGDHMGNFLTPFWYVVIGGMARIDFRNFFGYGLVFSAIWFVVGILVFTFAPC